MKAVTCELYRMLRGRWFWLTVLGTAVCLWLGLGSNSWEMIRHGYFGNEILELLKTALTGQSSVLLLPALAALPAANNALNEIRCGAMRMRVFRVGRRHYRVGKLAVCTLGAMLSQLLGMMLFYGVLWAMYAAHGVANVIALTSILSMITARLLAAGAYACLGAMIALWTDASASAYVAPMAACFTLKLLGSRFFIDVPYVDPSDWLAGSNFALGLTLILCVGMLILFDIVLRKEMRKNA